MSAAERRRRRRSRERLCAQCQERRARFQYRGRVSADRDHVLCFQCFRSERERMRARELVEGTATLFSRSSERRACPPYTLAQIAHRRAMLAHLESLAR